MNLVNSPFYDTLAVVLALLGASMTYLIFGHKPRQLRATLRDMTIIRKSELNKLRMEILGLKSNVELLQSAPIKKEADGQLRFDVPVETTKERRITFPHNKLVALADKVGGIVDVYTKVNGRYKPAYKLKDLTPITVIHRNDEWCMISRTISEEGDKLPNLYLPTKNVTIQQGQDVWTANDLARFKDEKHLVKRGKAHMWVDELEKGDVELSPCRWEPLQTN